MPELDPFDARLEAAVRAFADRAQTHVNASEVATRAVRRRTGVWAVLGRSVPVPVSLLVVLLLLLLTLVASLAVGGAGNRQGVVPPVAVTSSSPALASPSAESGRPTPAPLPTTDGVGDEVVAGTEVIRLYAPGAELVDGDTTRVQDRVIIARASMNDPRVEGGWSWNLSADLQAGQGPAWGTFRSDRWEGMCTGTLWAVGGPRPGGGTRSCWLTGNGAYDGYTYFLVATWSETGAGDVWGVIYPGSPPVP